MNKASVVFIFCFFCRGIVSSQTGESFRYPLFVDSSKQYIKLRDWPKSIYFLEKAIAVNPFRGDSWEQLGRIYYRNKDYEKAISAFKKAIELRAGIPGLYAYFISSSYALLGNKNQSLKWLQTSFDSGYGSIDDLKADQDLSVLFKYDPVVKKLLAAYDSAHLSTVEGRKKDVELLRREVKRVLLVFNHPDVLDRFNKLITALQSDMNRLTENQFTVRLMEAMAIFDGHTHAFPDFHTAGKLQYMPVQFFLFDEGLYITGATAAYKELLGKKILQVGNKKITDVLGALEKITAHDNDFGIIQTETELLQYPQILNGLGILDTDKKMEMTLEDGESNKQVSISSSSTPVKPDEWIFFHDRFGENRPLYLKDNNKKYWFTYLPAIKSVYLQFNQVFQEQNETFDNFCTRLEQFVVDNNAEKLIIDMRWNNGGNGYLAKPLLETIIKMKNINQKGHLFIITGRKTFSAAMITTGLLERFTNAIFVGEKTGSSPNFTGEDNHFTLPYSKIDICLSTRYHQNSWADDNRQWIAPQIYTAPTFKLYSEMRDPAMEGIKNYLLISGSK